MENRGLPTHGAMLQLCNPTWWLVRRKANQFFVSADQRLMRVPAGHVRSIYDSQTLPERLLLSLV